MAAEKDILDFIVVGAQKAGTTTLFEYLRQHPQIGLPRAKESPFFSHDDQYERGWEAYMRMLSADPGLADPSRRWGTVTPQYMIGGVFQPSDAALAGGGYDERTVPARIREQLPGVRLVAILRDPVARAISHHRMGVMAGRERRSFDEAIAQLLQPAALAEARRQPRENESYVARGEYGRILAAFRELFAAEQLLVVFTEALESDPAALLTRVHEFIGVEADFEPENLGERYRIGAIERGFAWKHPSSWMTPSSPFSPQGVQRALRGNPAARAAWRALPLERRVRLRVPYERLAHVVIRRNRKATPNEVAANAPPSPQTLERLREHYLRDTRRLTELIGETPPWAALAEQAQR